MGNWFCRPEKKKIIMQGLDAAGKTTVLYKMKLGEIVTTIPTIGFNVETVQVDGVDITCWDIGGRDKIRPLIRHYYPNSQGSIYLIDSHDKERLNEALEELVKFILWEHETRDTVVMVLANKQDMEGALSAQEIEDALVQKYTFTHRSPHTVFVMPCSATSGEGLLEAFAYFVTQLRLNASGKAKRGLIPLKEHMSSSEMQKDCQSEASSDNLKSLLRDPVGYFKTLFHGQ